MRSGQRYETELTDLSYLGGAVGHIENNLAVFASGGLPGERVVVEVDDRQRRYVRAHVVDVLVPAPERVRPPCPYFGTCGGCQWQHLAYEAQLRWKTELVHRQFRRIAHLESITIEPTIGAVQPMSYRNHARFSISPDGHLAFTRFQSHDFLPIDACLIMQPEIVAVMDQLRGLPLSGHQVSIRYGSRTGQLLVAPELPVAEGRLPTGQHAYEEEFLGRRYRVSASSFFQVNTRIGPPGEGQRRGPDWLASRVTSLSQAELLALLVFEFLDVRGSDFIVDAFCGVGTFALLAAERARRVVGIEEARCAVIDAEHNARGLNNVAFLTGRTEDLLGNLDERPDAVILDPSRVGCSPRIFDILSELKPRTIVYVSCDPATLARDSGILGERGYRLDRVQPLDMFPQTHHIEAVTRFTLAL